MSPPPINFGQLRTSLFPRHLCVWKHTATCQFVIPRQMRPLRPLPREHFIWCL